jgi:hypothetical protein
MANHQIGQPIQDRWCICTSLHENELHTSHYASTRPALSERSTVDGINCWCGHDNSHLQDTPCPVFCTFSHHARDACRVKNQKASLPAPPALPPDSHAHKGWISGVVYPDDVLLQQDNKTHLVMHTSLGDITVQLLPELAPATVREIQRAAKVQGHSIRGCSNCRIYRCAA